MQPRGPQCSRAACCCERNDRPPKSSCPPHPHPRTLLCIFTQHKWSTHSFLPLIYFCFLFGVCGDFKQASAYSCQWNKARWCQRLFSLPPALHGGRISVRWVTQLSKIAVTQFQDQTHTHGNESKALRRRDAHGLQVITLNCPKQGGAGRAANARKGGEEIWWVRSLDTHCGGKEEGGREKNTAPTQRRFSSAPGEGKVDIYPRRWRPKRVGGQLFSAILSRPGGKSRDESAERTNWAVSPHVNHAVYCFLPRRDRGLFLLPCAGAMSDHTFTFRRTSPKSFAEVVFFLIDALTHYARVPRRACCFSCHRGIRLTSNKEETNASLF